MVNSFRFIFFFRCKYVYYCVSDAPCGNQLLLTRLASSNKVLHTYIHIHSFSRLLAGLLALPEKALSKIAEEYAI